MGAYKYNHRNYCKTVRFEAFELSPKAKDVLASKGALECTFPNTAVAITASRFQEPGFQAELASFLEKASTESIKRFAAHTQKGGSLAYESRDTADPAVITQMLMALLQANGTREHPTLICKQLRDEVYWDKAEIPWRRSPFWLLLRVSIQRHLFDNHGEHGGTVLYKLLTCLVISQLLDHSLAYLSPELVVHIKAKLCRKLVKLEITTKQDPATTLYNTTFQLLRSTFEESTRLATQHIDNIWHKFRNVTQRRVLSLPKHADNRHLYLALPNSGSFIRNILGSQMGTVYNSTSLTIHTIPPEYDPYASNAKAIVNFTQRYKRLMLQERSIQAFLEDSIPECHLSCTQMIEDLYRTLTSYMTMSYGVYSSDPEQSSLMLLMVMEIWMVVDQCTVKIYPILKDFNPCFTVRMMDVLQITDLQDLRRLHKIRNYLLERLSSVKAHRLTIFDEPRRGCFAERFYNESHVLQTLHLAIEEAAKKAKAAKIEEWKSLSEEYEKLIRQAASSSCIYKADEYSNHLHHQDPCVRCAFERSARRLKIEVHEHPMPADDYAAKAVIFELDCPRAFAKYRDLTWKILSTFAFPEFDDFESPHVMIRDYSQLKNFSCPIDSHISLGSITKSFLKTHYANPRFPVRFEDVCLPNGLRLKYYDTKSDVWVSRDLPSPSFAKHCQLQIPSSSPFRSLGFSAEFLPDSRGPTSYQIISSQSKCPIGLNVHEYMAYQSLIAGKERRWHQILVELGSTCMNFGTEAAAALMRLIALQVGPHLENDVLGVVHRTFDDASFCRQFVIQLDNRLESISSNYRETSSMETLITLILRLVNLNRWLSGDAALLLCKARKITHDWIIVLRSEVQSATDAETSRGLSQYALWSALLNRRTYRADSNGELFNSAELICYIESSITLQDNMVSDPVSTAKTLKNAIVRDIKSIQGVGAKLMSSLRASPDSLISCIAFIWGTSPDLMAHAISSLEFDEPVGWIRVIIQGTEQTTQQTLHFHLMEGHLLVMGKPVGKLPVEHKGSVILRELFGDQTLLTYPSDLAGMIYRLAITPHGHQIHIGFRNSKLIVRARLGSTIYEIVPASIFGTDVNNFDLPKPLVDNCIHWLDINTGNLEIRQKPNIWRSKTSNWIINFYTRNATRRNSTLVDPHSVLASRVAHIFAGFEYHHELVLFQPRFTSLTVELRRLNLTFFVNIRNQLESPQLRAEIISNQDVGTWYGLDSKIVLREIIPRTNPRTCRPDHSLVGSQTLLLVNRSE